MAASSPVRPDTLPDNFPDPPALYPSALFRLQLVTAGRYLFESELKELLELAEIPRGAIESPSDDDGLNVAHVSRFYQELKLICGEDKAIAFGHDAFQDCTSLIPRANTPALARAVSSADKMFLRIRDAMSGFNRRTGMNVLVKWHGGAESDLFEDTAQQCYGYVAELPICHSLTGFLEEGIHYLSGVEVNLTEIECMARGALACRWHCALI
ncbi:MAG TPA: hypothetical protein VKQ72_06715 [Aggregatilineales bacterium]|nr:hypothetical protein [Aggregatilineales bacterium]